MAQRDNYWDFMSNRNQMDREGMMRMNESPVETKVRHLEKRIEALEKKLSAKEYMEGQLSLGG